jgi:hypothetical protein
MDQDTDMTARFFENLPHKSKRRQRSDKNTVSLALDI